MLIGNDVYLLTEREFDRYANRLIKKRTKKYTLIAFQANDVTLRFRCNKQRKRCKNEQA